MSGFLPSAGGVIGIPNTTYEFLGRGTYGAGTSVTSGSPNVLGSYTTIGTTTAAWSEFELEFGNVGLASARWLVSVRLAGTTVVLQEYFYTGANVTTQGAQRVRIPVAVPAGTLIEIAARASSGSQSFNVGIIGTVASANMFAGFSSFAALTSDTLNSRASSIDVPLDGTWTQLVATTAANYSALLASIGDNGSALATAQMVDVSIGIGGAGSEVPIYQFSAQAGTTAPYFLRANSRPIFRGIPAGTRLSARVLALTPGTDKGRVGIWAAP
jgi:hypothetical protein